MLWCLPRPDLYGPGLAALGSTLRGSCWSGRGATLRSLWAIEEGLRATGVAAVVGEMGALPAVASRRLQLAAERSGVTAFVLRRWRDGAQAARERGLPNAAATRWRIAALPSIRGSRRTGDRPPALAGRAVALPRRRSRHAGRWRWRMRRVLYLWLPRWPIDRMRRSARMSSRRKNSAAPAEDAPFATVIEAAGRRLLAAVNPAAAAAGLAPGMPLADALSFLPGLATAAAEPAEDMAALRRLAEWCGRYSPWTAPDGADGVRVEITGWAHLWGGEAALAADLDARLASPGHRLPYRHRRHARRRLGIGPLCADRASAS